ncbi:hotdog family protein [Shewanella aestuarii]|uniref:Hotdog family protein n=1 Tax=Shewanella aestuarii TaxID=1028752 RepID=A0A6G9QFH6_9GAMM|nr:hotdog family protein [Shewanella aestuarii]QIR13294.1 hotdog family protein [Shewanella aestuarii]
MTQEQQASPTLLAQDISNFIPHRSPMILVNEILSHQPDGLSTLIHITPQSPYFNESLNGVANYVCIEYMAQSIAALAGVEAKMQNQPIRVGFLLGSRKLQMHIPYFANGVSYRTQITRLYQEDSGLAVFDCAIFHEQTLVASANVNVFQPDDTHEYIKQSQTT